MNKKRLIFVFAFLLVAILLFSFASATYRSSNSKYLYGGIQSSFATNSYENFNPNMCREGQDFIIQVDPAGCTPAVVRSDLLEEQDVPVFCPLKAVKINPLMDVEVIRSMSFRARQISPGVRSNVGFYPTKAALSSNENLAENAVYDNIGYMVVMLKNQPNESAMPEFVEGNLTASIRYDFKNAFGIKRSSFYLPIMSEDEWQDKMVRYSFWDGRGYLRAEDIQEDSATITIYSDVYRTSFEGNTNEKRKLNTIRLQKGKSSEMMFLPGFQCLAGLSLKLEDVEYASTRALLKINSEYIELKEGEKFLDDKCYIKGDSIEKNGINKKLKIYCREDQGGFMGGDSFGLNIVPKIKLKVDDKIVHVSMGDAIYSNGESEKVYLGYAKMKNGELKEENLRIYLLSKPCDYAFGTCAETLSNDEMTAEASLAEGYELEEGSNIGDYIGEAFSNIYSRVSKTIEWIYQGDRHESVDFKEELDFKGSKITLLGFSDGFDVGIDSEQVLDYYGFAQESFDIVLGNFAGFTSPENESETLDKQALISNIQLSKYLDQSTEVKRLCLEFSNRFPKAENLDECKKITGLAEIGSKIEEVLINGQIKEISLVTIYEMSYKDYGVELLVRSSKGEQKTFYLEQGKTIYLDSLDEDSSEIFIVSQKLSLNEKGFSEIYFKYSYENKTWKWSSDMSSWIETDRVAVVEGTYDPTKEIKNLIRTLENKDGEKLNYYEGKAIFPVGTKENKGSFVKLLKINSLLEANLEIKASKGILETSEDLFINRNRVLVKNSPQTFDSKYTFTIQNINLKEYAKVSIVPKENDKRSEANFSFKIFIEKRAIQLSPEKIGSKVAKLNKTIEDWTKISEDFGTVVKTMKAACIAVSGYLTVKNLLENSDGKSMARTEIMKEDGGWSETCATLVDDDQFRSLDACYLNFSKDIEEDVDFLHKKLKAQNTDIENLQKDCMNENKFLESKSVDTRCLVSNLSSKVLKKLIETKITNPENEEEELQLDAIKKSLNAEGYGNYTYNMDQIKDIDLYYDLWKEAEKRGDTKEATKYKKKLYSILYQVDKNSRDFANVLESKRIAKENIGVNGEMGAMIVGTTKKEKVIYEGRETTSTWKLNSDVGYGEAIQMIYYDGESYFVILEDLNTENRYHIKKNKMTLKNMIYDLEGNEINQDVSSAIRSSISYFEKYDKTSYQNKYLNAEIKYYDSEPFAGQPALVPFDTQNGWYVYIRQTLGAGGNIGSYDLSAIPNSFVLCNVGANGLAEYPRSNIDDICEVINTKTGQSYNQFPGLDKQDSARIIDKAVDAINDAQTPKNKGAGERVQILGNTIPIGSPATNVPLTQCADFMSIKDCQTLFNVCDPVICPSSRCDFGGKYPVKDVVQSGIVGSLALCLPNFNEGVYVPICVSGVKAGLDSWLSVSRAYKDCLQENLDTGETIGICDEMNSIYMCEFFWRQALPLTKTLFPKLLEFVKGEKTTRGGGEYMFVSSALDSAQSSIDYLTQNYAVNSYNAFKLRNTEQIGSAVCKNFISITYPGGINVFESLIEPDSPSQFTGKFDEIPFSTVTNPAISHYKVYYHIYAGSDRGAYFQVYLRGGAENLFYEDDVLGRIVDSGYVAKGDYGSETVDFTAPSGLKQLCINVNGQEECGFGQVSTSFAVDYIKDQYISRQAEKVGIISEKACVSGTADWYSMLNPNLQEGVGDLIDPQIYNKGLIRICATENPGSGSADGFVGTEKQRWIDMGYCGDKSMRCWLDQNSVGDAVEFAYTEESVLENTGKKLLDDLFNNTEYNYLKDGEFKSKIDKINKERDFKKRLKLIEEIVDRVFYMNQKGYLHFLTGEAYAELAKKAYGLKSLVALEKGICEDKARDILLNSLDDLEGTSAGRGNPVEDCDVNNIINCYDVARYAYDEKSLNLKCVYSDKNNKKYTIEENDIFTSDDPVNSFLVNPKACVNQGGKTKLNEDEKLVLLRPGDLISYYWGYLESKERDYPHNAIFIKWINPTEKIAKLFDGNLGTQGSEKFRYYEADLKDSEHPVFMFWKPVLTKIEDIEGCGCVSDSGEKGICITADNGFCEDDGFVSNKCPGPESIKCCINPKIKEEAEDSGSSTDINFLTRFNQYMKDRKDIAPLGDYERIFFVDGKEQTMYTMQTFYGGENFVNVKENTFKEEGQILQIGLISTSKQGFGFETGSYKTPTGIFEIKNIIGEDKPIGTIFVDKKSTEEIAEIITKQIKAEKDLIISRIIVLKGLEDKNENTFQRGIYIHGTNEEGLLGTAVSEGSIRMENNEIIKYADDKNFAKRGDLVVILGDVDSVEEDFGIFDSEISPIFRFKEGLLYADMCVQFKDGEWYWTNLCDYIGKYLSGVKIEWTNSNQIQSDYGENRLVEREFINAINRKSLKDGFKIVFEEVKNEEGFSFTLSAGGVLYTGNMFTANFVSRDVYFRFNSEEEWVVTIYEDLSGDVKRESFVILNMDEKDFELFSDFEKSILKEIENKNLLEGAYLLFSLEEGVVLQDISLENPLTCLTLEEALENSVGLKGKYSDNTQNKGFVNSLCSNRCEKRVLSEKECENIKGEGEDLSLKFWEWRLWNVEENMDFVKNLLIKKGNAIMSNGEWNILTAYVKVDTFEEGGYLDKAYKEDGKDVFYSEIIREWYDTKYLMTDKVYDSFRKRRDNIKRDNIKPDLQKYFKSEVDLRETEKNTKIVTNLLSKSILLEQIDNAHPKLLEFIECLNSEYYDLSQKYLTITSITDDDLYGEKYCDLEDSRELFEDDDNCVHKRTSCHYYPSKGEPIDNEDVLSLAVDISTRRLDKASFKEALVECGSYEPKEYSSGDNYLDEDDHYHVALNECFSSS